MAVSNEVEGVGALSQLMARVQEHGWIGEIPRNEYEALKEYLTNTLASVSGVDEFEIELDVMGSSVSIFAVGGGSESRDVSLGFYLNGDDAAMFLISYDATGTKINLDVVGVHGYDGPQPSLVGTDWDEILGEAFNVIGDWMLKAVATHHLDCVK